MLKKIILCLLFILVLSACRQTKQAKVPPTIQNEVPKKAETQTLKKQEPQKPLTHIEQVLETAKPGDNDYAEKLAGLLVEPINPTKQARFVEQTDTTMLEGLYVQYRQDGQYRLDEPGVFMLIDYESRKREYTMELVFWDASRNENCYLYGRGKSQQDGKTLRFSFDGSLAGKTVTVAFVFTTAKHTQTSEPTRIIEYCTLKSDDFAYELFSGSVKLIMLF